MLHRKRIAINKLMCISARTALDSASRGTFAQSRRKGMLIRTVDIDCSDPAAQLKGEKNMTGSTFRRLLPALALVAAAVVPVASHAVDVRPMLKAGFDFGGDKLITVIFADGSTKSINANEGLYFGGGVSILSDSKDIETEVSLSYKTTGINASNGSVDWTRFPLEVLVFYRLPQFRLGGGLTYHLSPKLSGSGVTSVNLTFDNSAGFVLQADYLLQKITVGLRYTSLEYKLGGGSVKSDGVGVTFGISF